MRTHLDMSNKELVLATFMRLRSRGRTFAEARAETFQILESTLQMEWGYFKRKLDIWLQES